MELTPNNIVLVSAALLLLSVFAGRTGSRYGLPVLVLFLGVGMLAGVDGFGIHFDSAEVTQFIGMVSLSIILFSGGTGTRLRDIRPVLAPGITLATVGVLITTFLTGTFIYYLFHLFAPDHAFGWIESMLIAAIMSSTDSASVFSILGSARTDLKENLRQTLELESGSNDPVAYLLVIMLISLTGIKPDSIVLSDLVLSSSAMMVIQLAIGVLGGVITGYAAVWLVRRLKSDNEFMYPVLMIACVFFSFSLTELAGGNSYLSVYVSGLVVGNTRLPMKRTITTFFGGFTWLVQII
ncbi:MAG: cation:proton antiporter, partial [Paramuribaculum sp.]|nr:cation:proton antiporter [Paramuribaculum sp.]